MPDQDQVPPDRPVLGYQSTELLRSAAPRVSVAWQRIAGAVTWVATVCVFPLVATVFPAAFGGADEEAWILFAILGMIVFLVTVIVVTRTYLKWTGFVQGLQIGVALTIALGMMIAGMVNCFHARGT